MKCELKVEKFVPVTITIEIESDAEMRSLWHRFNLARGHSAFADEKVSNENLSSCYDVWELIDNEIIKRGMRK